MDFRCLFSDLSAAFFPHRCIFCDTVVRPRDIFCADCGDKLHLMQGGFRRGDGVDGLLSVYRYDNVSKRAVFRLKFYGDKSVVKPIAALMAEKVKSAVTASPERIFDMVIPVPMYFVHERKRGYNQSLLLAKEVASSLSIPLENDLLLKTVSTKKQHDLTGAQRSENLSGAFTVSKEKQNAIKGKRILLLDDVCTTGNTFSHCAEVLKQYGAKAVYGLSFLGRTNTHLVVKKGKASARYRVQKLEEL